MAKMNSKMGVRLIQLKLFCPNASYNLCQFNWSDTGETGNDHDRAICRFLGISETRHSYMRARNLARRMWHWQTHPDAPPDESMTGRFQAYIDDTRDQVMRLLHQQENVRASEEPR